MMSDPQASAGKLDVHSRSLQWMRSPDEVAEAAIEMVVPGVCPTVQAYPGHIDPARVAQELPAFRSQAAAYISQLELLANTNLALLE